MTSRQLANVLIKMIGLIIVLKGIPSVITGTITGLSFLRFPDATGSVIFPYTSYAIGAAIQMIVGVFIVRKSQKITVLMFSAEDE